jgi:hypothetical protein
MTYLSRIWLLLAGCLPVLNVFAQTSNVSYPKELKASSGETITVYQPQPETFSGNRLTGRAALSIRKSAKDEPVFGAVFFAANLNTDKDTRVARLDSIKITNAKFPGLDDKNKLNALIKLLETEIPKWDLRISIDALVASVKQENAGTKEVFKNDPPEIFYRDKPTTLVFIDGEPKIQKDKDLDADRVVNTPSLLFKDEGKWCLYTGGVWYKSKSITSGWEPNTSLNKKLSSIDEQVKKQESKNEGGSKPTEKPKVTEILVSTKPTELLQTDGAANYKTVQGTSLLYAANTTNQIFKDINTQKTYTLLSGRWYQAAALTGPWEYIAADKLPADFAKIPEGSEKDDVLASVAGTPAAEEAKIDAQIPQTAKVDRKTAKVEVKYDGKPQFKKIEGTSLELAENSNVTVIKDNNGKYYAVDNGVWFVAAKAEGPWSVADERPKDVSKIPPSSEAYNTKYVYVYESTPEVVYVGYTPGYTGCYIYGPTVVYGTGYHYAPWYGAAYYPRPVTWGFGFSYNPWTGWSMNFGFSTGYMHVGFSFGGYGGWYGPPRYYPPYRPPYYGGGYYGGGNGNRINNGNINNINIDEVNIGGGNRNNQINHYNRDRNNIYNNQNGVSTLDKKPGQSLGNRGGASVGNQLPAGGGAGGNRGGAGVNNQLPAGGGGNGGPGGGNRPTASQQPNNVYADRDGNVYQRDNKGNWNQRDNKSQSWQPTSRDNPSVNGLNQQSQARDRGNQRTNNFNQSRGSYGGGGGARGGGGRRR